jgi:predicted ester cyclase
VSLEKNKGFVRRVNEALNRKDLSVIDEFMIADYVDHTNQLRGLEDVKRFYAGVFKDLPDFHREIEDIIAEGEKVWARFRITGTLSSGKKVDMTTVSMLRIVDSKAVEGWAVPRVTGQDQSIDKSLYD